MTLVCPNRNIVTWLSLFCACHFLVDGGRGSSFPSNSSIAVIADRFHIEGSCWLWLTLSLYSLFVRRDWPLTTRLWAVLARVSIRDIEQNKLKPWKQKQKKKNVCRIWIQRTVGQGVVYLCCFQFQFVSVSLYVLIYNNGWLRTCICINSIIYSVQLLNLRRSMNIPV